MNTETRRNRVLIPILSLAAIALFPGCEENRITDLGDGEEFSPRPTYELVVEPANLILDIGEAVQLRACFKNAQTGHLSPVDPVAAIRWTSQDPRRATVSADGFLEAHAAGPVTISVQLEGEAGPAWIPQHEAQAMVRVK